MAGTDYEELVSYFLPRAREFETVLLLAVTDQLGCLTIPMSIAGGPEAQDALFEPDPSQPTLHAHNLQNVPSNIARATLRLQFTPTYVIVGVYRLFTDENLYMPAWKKCKHATVRGAIVGAVWVRCRDLRSTIG